MKKTIMGAICAIALCISMTSCHEEIRVNYDDIENVTVHYNDYGRIEGYSMRCKEHKKQYEGVGYKTTEYEISPSSHRLLSRDASKLAGKTIILKWHHAGYIAHVSDKHDETITLNK